ncbi:MAG: hypothetical protein EA376_09970 [Phycisphaeraceae bacterium]|nr:MAG: hypothetical protein EA376_09970 [Phycisphaeraceae bacterium]
MTSEAPNPQDAPEPAAAAEQEAASLRRAADSRPVRLGAAIALVAVGVGAILAWLFIAGVHISDRRQIDHVSGAWMALAMHANEEGLYPELFDGERYGCTRFMPVPIVVHAGLARITGEYIMSGKLLNGLSLAALLGVVCIALRKHNASTPLAIALTGSILLTSPGMLAGTSIRNDALPAALQLIAVLLITRPRGVAIIAGAGFISALAVLCKLSAIWAPMAIGLWLLATNRRGLAVYCAGFAIMLSAGLGGFHLISGGRMFENLFGLSTSGIEGFVDLVRGPFRLLANLQHYALLTWVLLPFALCLTAMAALTLRFSIIHLALLCSFAPLSLAFADSGVGHNHLIDLVALIALCIGVRRTPRPAWSPSEITRVLAAIVLIWTAPFVALRFFWRPLTESLNAALHGERLPMHDADVFRDAFGADERLLSDDPFVSISRGELPVVMDAFMLLRIGRDRPDWIEPLLERIEAREFDAVVTVHALDSADEFYTTLHFGRTILDALNRSYIATDEVGGYTVHRRRSDSAGE